MTLSELVTQCHQDSKKAGWWPRRPDLYTYITKIALLHSEVSEMLEGLRKKNQDKHLTVYPAEWVEAADVFIRLADYCGAKRIPLQEIVLRKLEYNKTRDDHKMSERNKPNGKQF